MSLRALFSSIADAIRYVIGGNNKIVASNFPNEIRAIKDNMQEIEIVPSTENQVKEGLFNKVTVIGDENLKAENISEGTTIFGIEGTAKTTRLKITDASYLFYKGARINQINEILSLCKKVTTTDHMFYYCDSLRTLDLSNFDTSNVTNMYYMFGQCAVMNNLNVSNFDTSKVTNMASMFYYCQTIQNLDLSSFDTSNVNSISSIFSACSKLGNLKSFSNLGKGYTLTTQNNGAYKLDLSACKRLDYASLMDVINKLYDLNLTYDVANGGTLYTQSLVLGSSNLAKLTADEIAIATNKGWNVS